jgi:hypothetical protein
MKAINLPCVGDVLLFGHCEVMVSKVLTCSHAVETCRSVMDSKFYVDANALSPEPNHTALISIGYFGRGGDE